MGRRKRVKGGSNQSAEEESNGCSSSNSDSCPSERAGGGAEDHEGQQEEADAEEEGEGEGEGGETWVQWMIRTAGLADVALRRAKVADWVEEQKRLKWRWAGHVARREDGRWSRRLLDWAPTKGGRRVGRPARRWEDDLSAYKQNWRELAQDRDVWAGLEDQFVKVS